MRWRMSLAHIPSIWTKMDGCRRYLAGSCRDGLASGTRWRGAQSKIPRRGNKGGWSWDPTFWSVGGGGEPFGSRGSSGSDLLKGRWLWIMPSELEAVEMGNSWFEVSRVVLIFLRAGPGCKGLWSGWAQSGAIIALPLTGGKGGDGRGWSGSILTRGRMVVLSAARLVTMANGSGGAPPSTGALEGGSWGCNCVHLTSGVTVVGVTSSSPSHGREQSTLEWSPAHLMHTWAYVQGFAEHGLLELLEWQSLIGLAKPLLRAFSALP
jgi:hypothetical protein